MSDKELADKLEQLASDVRTYGKAGTKRRWGYGSAIETGNICFDYIFRNPERYTRLPDTIDINEYEVELGMREEPETRTMVYVVEPTECDYCAQVRWIGSKTQKRWLALGLIHATPEAAAKHGEALASFTRRGE